MASVNALMLVFDDRSFDFILDYYRMFPQEVSPVANSNLAVVDASPYARFADFGELVNRMIFHANKGNKNFLVASHGIENNKQVPIALGMPIDLGTPSVRATDFFFETMEDWRKRGLTKEQAAEEGKLFFNTAKGKVHLPPGVLSRIHGSLINLRKLQLQRVEIRACALGKNATMMDNVRTVLGAGTLTAPDVHMFYGGPVSFAPLTRPYNAAEFASWLTRHQRARQFSDGNRRFASEVHGQHAARLIFSATTDSSLGWFVDKFIMPGSKYPSTPSGGAGLPPPFIFAAMDLDPKLGKPFALPLESEYAAHITKRP